MARVFLSYDRDDGAKARPVAAALESAGHSVWWDRHIQGGAQYSKEIDKALRQADAVVVLWSEHSVESPWVRDEAAAGRDSGRLVPLAIDGTDAPLGFRQYHTLDLSRWRGRGRPHCLNELLAAISALADQSPTETQTANTPPATVESGWRTRRQVAALLLLALVVAGGLVAWKLIGRSSRVSTVAVASADQSPKSQALARDLLVKLGSLRGVTANSMQLVEQRSSGPRATLIFKVGDSGSGEQPEANVALFDGKDHSLLWSKDFEQPSGKLADLKQQVAYTSGQVLACAREGLSPRRQRLNQQTLKLYLQGCAAYTDKTADNLHTLVPLFRQLTRTAPDFAGGWAKLLLVESEFTRMDYVPESTGIVAPLPVHIATARKLDPNMPEAFLAEAYLLPDMAFERRISLLERAVKVAPDNAAALNALSDNLLLVGRMNDGVAQAQRAVQANPLSPTARDSLIAALTYAGKADAARAELEKAEQLWPGTSSVVNARYRINLRYGEPSEAMRLIRSGEVSTSETPYIDSFVEARIHPTPANIDRAITEARSFYDRQPTTIYHLIQVLGTFGREEELFPILLNWSHPDRVSYVTDALFRPALRKAHHDPRMMAIAKRLGLLDYWRKTGNWPDFCFEPNLPYDCKKEAVKLTA